MIREDDDRLLPQTREVLDAGEDRILREYPFREDVMKTPRERICWVIAPAGSGVGQSESQRRQGFIARGVDFAFKRVPYAVEIKPLCSCEKSGDRGNQRIAAAPDLSRNGRCLIVEHREDCTILTAPTPTSSLFSRVSSLLVFALLARLLPRTGAFAGALLFAAHPNGAAAVGLCAIVLLGIMLSARVAARWRTPLNHWETTAWHARGLLALLRGNCSAAAPALDRALALRPNDKEIAQLLARCR